MSADRGGGGAGHLIGLDHPRLADATGTGVRVAVIDSGVHAGHEHIAAVSGGVTIGFDGAVDAGFVDRLGHGTAVAAAILEKAPAVELLAVKVFDLALSAPVGALVDAIDWAAERRVDLINLSLGTEKAEHEQTLREAVLRAAGAGAVVVSAAAAHDRVWLPGSLPEAIGVHLDRSCPRHALRMRGTDLLGSGYPRPIDGVAPEHNLQGISFAVANVTGILCRALEGRDRAGAPDADTGEGALAFLYDRLHELAHDQPAG